MMQKILADRFTLVIHRDRKTFSAYGLTVGKAGPTRVTTQSAIGATTNVVARRVRTGGQEKGRGGREHQRIEVLLIPIRDRSIARESEMR
jgi:uncharacterized protein (TIGR03435 family)